MKDKYLDRDGIAEKYYNKDVLIHFLRDVGTIGGGVCVLFNFNSLGGMLVGGGFVGISYLTGDYLSKRNEEKKEKALKNFENRAMERTK